VILTSLLNIFRSADKQRSVVTDNREEVAPLNLSTRSHDKEDSSPLRHGSDSLGREELPLNLSIRPSHINPSVWSTTETPQWELGVEMDEEEVCDQRQTAALALCQLASASSATSYDLNRGVTELEESSSTLQERTKSTTETEAKIVKRKNKDKYENDNHKPTKRAKTTGRAVRRRPRCC
ncbi:hypothetical protein NL108_002940, partial [Boleophthalmus pectinirostris]